MVVLWVVLAVVLGVVPGWPITSLVLRWAHSVQAGDDRVQDPGVLRGGRLIGLLERAAIVVAILYDQPVAIAYVVAIKGLGRYPELKETPSASERFIIGTLCSMLWAAVVAGLVKVLLL